MLAIDPGYRSGCKLAALDEFGNLLANSVIHIVGKEDRKRASRKKLAEMIRQHNSCVVAIGNGAACRQTEQLVAEIISDELKDLDISYVIVNEAGASVYSTSPLGREELPNCDAVQRSAISIGRRLLDPLSELVKINAANIGVGLYQHDLKSKHLEQSLDGVVESCVNFVGVDVNSASPALLRYVSGLNQLTARRLYEHRCEHGPFRSREQLKEVSGFGDAAFVQAAGFLKINGGENPLDSTWIHPESYSVALGVLEKIGCSTDDLDVKPAAQPAEQTEQPAELANSEEQKPAEQSEIKQDITEIPLVEEPAAEKVTAAAESEIVTSAESQSEVSAVEPAKADETPPSQEGKAPATEQKPLESNNSAPSKLAKQASSADAEQLVTELNVGKRLLRDILASLIRPGRDPRDDFPPPIFRKGILKIEDLEAGMELTGTVLNVVDFGAFVDIGLSDSGLVHISRLADRYISDPHEVVSVGDILKVWVVEVDKQRRRVSLTGIKPGTEKPQRPRPEKRSDASKGGRRRPAVKKKSSGQKPAIRKECSTSQIQNQPTSKT